MKENDNILKLISDYCKTHQLLKVTGGKLFHTMVAIPKEDPNSKRYEFEYPDMMGCYIAVYAHCKSCLFCDHLEDIYYDHNGPYMMFCDLRHEHLILNKACSDFKDREDNNDH